MKFASAPRREATMSLVSFLLIVGAQADLQAAARRSTLASQGIVVPKRSTLIVGLNQQFKLKQTDNTNSNNNNNNNINRPSATAQILHTDKVFSEQNSTGARGSLASNLNWISSRIAYGVGGQPNGQRKVGQPKQALYLDRHQQEILAANPNLLNPAAGNVLSTRSDSPTPALANNLTGPQLAAGRVQQPQQQQQQLYRGFSLIELEVKSESDRRYVQDLYGNLSAAINEQARSSANNNNTNNIAVSPYVDVDFWSLKYALNEQIDIMVSPKSRAFILAQLNRNKIRHRIKIDDIQARLEQQQQQQQASGFSQSDSQMSEANQLSGRGNQPAPTEGQLNGRRAAAAETGPGANEQLRPRSALNESLFFDNYQRLADINQYVESIVERNRDVASVKVIGRSSQGRYLRVLKLGYDQQDGPATDDASDELLASGPQPKRQQIGNNASHILEGFFKRQAAVQKLGSIWLDGGTHAREWISPATTLYIMFRLSDNHARCVRFYETLRVAVAQAAATSLEQAAREARRYPSAGGGSVDTNLIDGINEINTSLLGKPVQQSRPRTELEHTIELLAKSPQKVATEYGCDLDVEQLLRRYTFYIMPVLNPDGYEYSHTHNRLWRKTRSTSNHPIYRHFCLGADPNRNYDTRHLAAGSSSHPCSQTYAGTVPFTEPETRHQSNFVYSNREAMKMFISFHSYSQMILLPFSHSKQLAPDHKDLDSVGQAAAKAIEATHGTVYRVGPSANILYTASGTASDWAYEKAGIKYSYTIELRDTGNYGFLLPRQQIIPTGEETFNGLLAMIGQMEKNDNLLTSKSSVLTPNGINATITAPADHSHVPELDYLKPLSKQATRAPLENVLDGSDWAPDAHFTGVRDRKPTSSGQASAGFFDSERPEGAQFSDFGRLGGEPTGDENEPDSGYAFEGEGELMEPTNENILEAAKMSDLLLSGRHDHSRRIAQSSGLTSSGRSLINSPLSFSRTTPDPPKRESSNEISDKTY